MHSAVENRSISFNQLHNCEGQGRIKYKRSCSACDGEVAFGDIVEGYEYEKDHYVTFSGDELDRGSSGVRSIDIVKFVPLSDIDPVYFERPYYLAPTETVGAKPYKLLLKALADDQRVAVCRVAFRDKEHLAVLRVVDDVLVLETMHWPDEIRDADFATLDVEIEPTDAEVAMAKMLIDNLTGDFEPGEFKDTYRERLEELVSAKIDGREVTVIETQDTAKVIDLMEALRASVEATKDGPKTEESATG